MCATFSSALPLYARQSFASSWALVKEFRSSLLSSIPSLLLLSLSFALAILRPATIWYFALIFSKYYFRFFSSLPQRQTFPVLCKFLITFYRERPISVGASANVNALWKTMELKTATIAQSSPLLQCHWLCGCVQSNVYNWHRNQPVYGRTVAAETRRMVHF